jgi:D-alanyl-D-alanine carboxypeptidase
MQCHPFLRCGRRAGHDGARATQQPAYAQAMSEQIRNETLHERLAKVWETAHLSGVAAAQTAEGTIWLPTSGDGRDGQYLIYSVTKIFIALTYLGYADRNLLSLDDPVSAWLPIDLPRGVTLRRLLNHTAGIPDYGRLPEYHQAVMSHPGTPWTDEEFLKRAMTSGLEFEPGTRFNYSNTGYLLLRRLLDRLAAGGFAGAVHKHILEPLGLEATFLPEDPEGLIPLVPGESTLVGPAVTDVRGVYHPHWVGHRVLASTVHDLLRFAPALTSGCLLSSERLQEMLTGVEVGVDSHPFKRPRYGLGVMLDQPGNDHGVVGHLGGGPGYGAALFRTYGPGSAPTIVVVLSNRDGDSAVERVALTLLHAAARASA